jgi:hypothetical protein
MGAGWTSRDSDITIEDVRDRFDAIHDTSRSTPSESLRDDLRALVRALQG